MLQQVGSDYIYLVSPMQEERDDDQDDEKREHEAGHHEHHRVHAHGADLLAGLSVLSVVVRAEVEALDQEVATILLGCAEVVASEDQRGVFDLEDLDL